MNELIAYSTRCPYCGVRIITPDVWKDRQYDPDEAIKKHCKASK